MTDHYATLKVSPDAEAEVIAGAYKALMKLYHPDTARGDPQREALAKAINAAFDVLKDPVSRARYDRERADHFTDAGAGYRTASSANAAPPPPEYSNAPQAPVSPATRQARPGGREILLPLLFIGLSAFVGIGGVGSLMQGGSAPSATAAQEWVPQDAALNMTPATTKAPPRERDGAEAKAPSTAETEPSVVSEAPPASDPCGAEVGTVAYLVCADPAVARAHARLLDAYQQQLARSEDPERLSAAQAVWISRQDALPADRDRMIQAFTARTREVEADALQGLY